MNGGVAVYTIRIRWRPECGDWRRRLQRAMAPSRWRWTAPGAYVYAANRLDNSISGYTIVPPTATAGLSLTPLKGSPYVSGISVQSLGLDNTGKYLLAGAVGGSPDLTMYSFDITVPGKLDPVTSVATATDPAGASAIALTH